MNYQPFFLSFFPSFFPSIATQISWNVAIDSGNGEVDTLDGLLRSTTLVSYHSIPFKRQEKDFIPQYAARNVMMRLAEWRYLLSHSIRKIGRAAGRNWVETAIQYPLSLHHLMTRGIASQYPVPSSTPLHRERNTISSSPTNQNKSHKPSPWKKLRYKSRAPQLIRVDVQ